MQMPSGVSLAPGECLSAMLESGALAACLSTGILIPDWISMDT